MLFSTLITLALPLSTLAAPSGMRRVSRRGINKMPAEAAVSSQNGVLKPYKRSAVDVKNGQDAIALKCVFLSFSLFFLTSHLTLLQQTIRLDQGW
jgi:hypothetical protein